MEAKKFNYRAVILGFLAVAVFLALFALSKGIVSKSWQSALTYKGLKL